MAPRKKKKRWIWISLVLIILIAAVVFYKLVYERAFLPNVTVAGKEEFLLIPTGSTMQNVTDSLTNRHLVKNINSFLWVANKKNYPAHMNPGRYRLTNGMSNNDLVNLLRSGKQTPVNVTFNNVRTKEDLAGKIHTSIEADSIDFIHYFDTSAYFQKIGIDSNNILTLFIPDTYQFYWNTSAGKFMERMKKEHDKFWTQDRKDAAKTIGLTEQQVYTLASVVYSETKMSNEAPRVAGVYMNRLKKDMPLQADPTIIFAIGDFSITRVLDADREVVSPYNTYKHTGLPPGPICMPPISYIDAVLHYEHHDYYYFCAKEDFSGYSNFAKTLDEHLKNAAKYQKALNERGIYR